VNKFGIEQVIEAIKSAALTMCLSTYVTC